jgi:dihydroflavonol-4-reductase
VTAFRRATSSTTHLNDLDLRHAIGDITDVDAVSRAIKGQDIVIHAAAHLAYWRYWRALQTQINVDGTRNIVMACQQSGVRRLVFVSSVAAIGIPSDAQHPADETFAFNLERSGLNYPISKRRAEEVVLAATGKGLDAVIVNPASIAGPFDRSFRGGEMIEKVRHSRVVPYFMGGISVVHIEDVMDGLLAALERGRCGERYILGGENISFRQIAELAAQRFGVIKRLVPIFPIVTGLAARVLEPVGAVTGKRPRITYDAHYCASRYQYYDSSKAKKELGYDPRPYAAIVDEYLANRSVTSR